VIWPAGYYGEGDALIAQDGMVVARVSDHLKVGGGEWMGDGWLACPGKDFRAPL
jgi:hypothetical protein